MRLEIRAFGTLMDLVPQGPMELKGPTSLKGLLILLAQRCGSEFERQVYDPKAGALNPQICISVNGSVVSNSDLKRQVEENDRIAIFTLLSGGTLIAPGRFGTAYYASK